MTLKLIITSILAAALTVALALPGAASADSVDGLAAQVCKQERKDLGKKRFTKKYGKAGTRACLAKARSKARAAVREATQDCTDELAQVGTDEFEELYGGEGPDAFSECVVEGVDWILAPPGDSGDDEEEEEE